MQETSYNRLTTLGLHAKPITFWIVRFNMKSVIIHDYKPYELSVLVKKIIKITKLPKLKINI